MADIFVNYTESDRDWAFWIGQELEKLGHTPHIHAWEISGGGDIAAWMDERHDQADHVLLVISGAYFTKTYSNWERRTAQWAAVTDRPNFALPVFIEPCKAPTLLAPLKRCDLYGVDEHEARQRLEAFLKPASKPSKPTPFPGGASRMASPAARSKVAFPGAPTEPIKVALSNIPIAVPRHFLGRDDDLAAIDEILRRDQARVAITTLHGMRGVGKTTLAAAYAERHRGDYRATWWIRAQTPDGMRADLVALGVRLNWVAADDKEEPALAAVIERLRDDGAGILLIFDNAIDAESLRPYLPRGGAAHVLVTSNSPTWRNVATPVEIGLWPKDVGADYLIARTGRQSERAAAESLSDALGGLPLAHEQAAAYCERLEVSFSEYRRRFDDTPAIVLDDSRHAPADYHDGLTVAKTFALAIDEAAKLHPAAEPLIVHLALLAPEPIPLFIFSEGRKEFGEPLASALEGNGLIEAVAALRTFALVDREAIADERDPAITTDCIRLHRLVRQVAAARCQGEALEAARNALVAAVVTVYPGEVYDDPKTWPKARRLDAIALALVDGDPTRGSEVKAAYLLDRLGTYRQAPLAAYAQARPLFERALAIGEKVLGPEHPDTATSLSNLAIVVEAQGDLAAARSLQERALAIREKVLGPEHPETATSLNNRATFMQAQGDHAGARWRYERALAIDDKALGPDHPSTNIDRRNLASLLLANGSPAEALALGETALAAHDRLLGRDHSWTKNSARITAAALDALGRAAEAAALRERYGIAS